MTWFRRKTQVLDAEHLLHEAGGAASGGGEQPSSEAVTSAVDGGIGSVGFRLTVTDVFAIRGRGTVVTGQVEAGQVGVGSLVTLNRDGGQAQRVRVTGVEMFRKTLDTAVAGQNVGLLLENVGRDDVAVGDVLSG